jgi:hypothetical protein
MAGVLNLKSEALSFLAVILVPAICLVGTEVKAQESLGKKTLAHLEGVFVHVGVAETIEEIGLDEQSLETSVELQLRKAGVTIYEKEEFRNKEAGPGLALSVTSIGTIKSMSIYYIELNVDQSVVLSDGREARAFTYTTQESGAALASMTDTIRDDVKQLVKTFLNDWLEVH